MKTLKLIVFFVLITGMATTGRAQFTNYDTINSDLPSNYCAGGVAVDTNNNVWVGTDAGVAKFDGTNWTVFTTAQGLPVNIIACIAVDNQNNVWIGTDGDGVAKYNGSTWTTYTYSDGLCDNGIHYIACDASGDLWFGSWGAGVSRLSGSTFTTFNAGNGFPDDMGILASVFYITVDDANNKWFATDMGLVKYDNTSFTLINQSTAPGLLSDFLTAVAVDDAGNKWLGVLASGIAKLDASNNWVANYDTTNGIIDNGITDIKIDGAGNIWLGEYTSYGAYIEGGITKFNAATGTGVSYTEADGLINDQVFRIAPDHNGDLWIATGEGLSKFHDANGITENPCTKSLSLYPNPATDNIIVNHKSAGAKLCISDMTGRIVTSSTMDTPASIGITNLEPGLYFITLSDNENIFAGKFLKY